MKLDPGMHIGFHLVFFGKSGVTEEKGKGKGKGKRTKIDLIISIGMSSINRGPLY
jgi:hypothetical protein